MGTTGQESLPLGSGGKLQAADSAIYYGMRLMPWVSMRRLMAKAIAAWVGAYANDHCENDNATCLYGGDTLDVNRINTTLRSLGWTPLPPLLDARQLDDILAYLRPREMVAGNGSRFTADNPSHSAMLASYPLDTVLHCPHIVALMNRPDILALAQAYLGCRPTISGLRIDWSCPSQQGPGDVQQFHRDYDDWKFFKLFVYLTDVDDESGPHEFVATSHTGSGRVRARPYTAAQVEQQYGKHNMTRILGPRGTCFMVDTWGIHKGNIPQKGWRMMLQIQYSILPVLKFNYSPVSIPIPEQFDKHTNRLLVA